MAISNRIKVRIFGMDEIKEYEDIRLVRLVSADYSLLIMDEQINIVGEINGTVTINSSEVDVEYRRIKGYYVHDDNVFNLFIKEY